jgi:hypothetical protein
MTQVGKPFWISTEPGQQLRPVATYFSSTKDYLAVWRAPAIASGYATKGRLVTADAGVNKKTITVDDPGFALFFGTPDVGHVGADTGVTGKMALVAWSTSTLFGGRIRARFVSASGAPQGSTFDVSSGFNQVWPDARVHVACNAKTNRFLVAWDGKNKKGFRVPRAAVVDANGKVLGSTIVGDATGKVTQMLEGVCADPTSGTWLVAYDKYCRLLSSTGTPTAAPVTAPHTLRMFDAVATSSGYRVIGCEPFMQNKLRVWTRILTTSSYWSGNQHILFSTRAMHWATAVANPNLASWLLVYGHQYSTSAGIEVNCRKVGFDGSDVDGKPFGVVAATNYQATKGRASGAANTARTESLVVWSEGSGSDVKASVVDTQDGLIIVEDDVGNKLPWSYVTVNGKWAGFTNASGWLVHPLKVDDEIAARRLVHIGASKKGGHDPFNSGKDWSYHVWHTSVRIRDDGTPEVWKVVDPTQDQVVTIRDDNTLFGHNLVVSFQWDASSSEIATLRSVLHKANDFLYNATDGQVVLEFVKIRANKQEWSTADAHVLPGTGRSSCNCPISNPPSHLKMYWLGQLGSSGDAGVWTHELLHYLCNLHDEYEDGTKLFCTKKLEPGNTGTYALGGPKSSCPMSGMHNSGPWELCTNLSENPHNKATWQGSTTCWEICSSFLSSSPWAPANGRWRLRTPNTRGKVVPGPSKVPVSSWCKIDNPTSRDPIAGEPAGWSAWLSYPDFTATTDIPSDAAQTELGVEVVDAEGRGCAADLWAEFEGRMERLGSVRSDGTLEFSSEHLPGLSPVRVHATRYSPSADEWWRATALLDGPAVRMDLTPQPVELGIRLLPTGDVSAFDVLVTADQQLDPPPALYASPYGLDGSIQISLHVDGRGRWLGRFYQEQGSEDGGVLWVQTGEGDDRSLVLVEYQVVMLDPSVCHKLGSGDSLAVLVLAPGTEPQTIAALTRCRLPRGMALPGRYVLAGGPYDLAATTPHVAGLLRCFPPGPFVSEHAAIELIRWDEDTRKWEPLPTAWNSRLDYFSAEIELWERGDFRDPRTVYALVAAPPERGLAHGGAARAF